ncbi:cell division cycle protein 20 homolog isoform X1 [Halyomorpha halys]|uniref:cell division cycle protein 20 homolog isoform X1 n=1 Tax=Halyomorpha halys TaxID=286706 RepID=UPI0006D4D12C|nr:cell division cycle protein 20 homolog isoform X1 [Halyomorpha halys]XP_014286018.1 cell division cycle protein 20 homolog isoform X1 [Halyomorpha halys]
MAQFTFVNELNNVLRMDDPIRGPVPRWQKKGDGSNNSIINSSLDTSKIKGNYASKTPKKMDNRKTPSKTPSKTPKNSPDSKTPGKGKTPGGDRFIPTRSATDFELGHFKLNDDGNKDDEAKSPSQVEMERAMTENLAGRDLAGARILAFQKKAPEPPGGHQNPLKIVYSQSKTPKNALTRYIPQAPDRILDAPDILDDYYLNLVDWSKSNLLAVALGSSVYLWNASSGAITQLTELEGNDYVSSLSWITDGDTLAIGTSLGNTQIWDTTQSKKMRVMDGHSARVGSLSWNQHILSSGCRGGLLVHHDVRQRDHVVSSIEAHSQEICGLKWSPDGRYLASGGNDNILNIWSCVAGDLYSQSNPLYRFSEHQAAVKALAWCPWQPSILASGGGTADRHIRFWNCNTGLSTNSIDTKSQVCGLLWSPTYKELISGHGYANNQLIIWKYPSLVKVAELTGHTARVLQLAMSPDGSTVLSAGADETLRLWKCFAPNPNKKKEGVEAKVAADSIFKRGIR